MMCCRREEGTFDFFFPDTVKEKNKRVLYLAQAQITQSQYIFCLVYKMCNARNFRVIII